MALGAIRRPVINDTAKTMRSGRLGGSAPACASPILLAALGHSDHQELHQSLIVAGHVPDENGSFMSVVHETVVGVRAALTGISKKTLPAFASGEQNIIEEYDDALREMSSDPKINEILKRQKGNLLTKIAEMKKISA